MFAASRDFRIRYQVWGSGPALVLVHGFPMWGDRWRDMGYVSALEGRYQLIVPDLIGHGRSDKPHDPAAYGAMNMASDVLAILDAENVEQAHVWGFSMGAMVAQAVSVLAHGRVLSLTIGGSPPGLRQEQLDAFAPATIPATWDELLDGLPQAVIDMFVANNSDFEAVRACSAALWRQGATIDHMRAASCPTLVYIGAQESWADLARTQCEALPCRFELVPGGHVEAFRHAANVLSLVVSHIEAAEASAAPAAAPA